MYPNANIWLTGHSVSVSFQTQSSIPDSCVQLGGALSSLIGLSFGAPVVAFESPADRLAAQRLHLPLPPGLPMEKMGVTHVYHNADPIPMGVCTGVYSESNSSDRCRMLLTGALFLCRWLLRSRLRKR